MLLSTLKLIRLYNIAFIALFQVIVRYCIVLPILALHNIEPMLSDVRFIMLVVATMLIAAGGNVINDYFDVTTDKINRPTKVVVDKHLDRRTAILIHVVLTLIGVFIGLYLSFVFRKENYALLFIAVPIVLLFYSTTFKKKMLVGNLIVAMLTALTALLVVSVEFAALAHYNGAALTDSLACKQAWFFTSAFAFYAFLSNLIREIIKDMEDIEGDNAVGCTTLPIEMGTKYSKIIVILLECFMLTTLCAALFFAEPAICTTAQGFVVLAAIALPTFVGMYMLIKAQTNRQYHRVSTLCKVVMLIGTLSIVYLYYIHH
jgi:4-hydroxybenzoate polyprenyltransferase